MTQPTALATLPVTTPIGSGWTLEPLSGPVPAELAGRRIPATVPGSVHTDLLAAGLIDDPYRDDNERLVAWIGSCGWRYSTTFTWMPGAHDHTELVFHGLDTVARVTLNGTEILSSVNMHRTYRVDVRSALAEGENTLVIDFDSPIKYADAQSLALGYRPHVNHHPYNAIRKMACSFGWDWGLDTATSGIWRPIELVEWSDARLATVLPTALKQGDGGTLRVTGVVDGEPGCEVRVRVAGGEASGAVVDGAFEVSVDLQQVAAWWPRGWGDPTLHEAEVELVREGTVVDSWVHRVGFRSIELDLTPDADGTPMTFIINGERMFIRGANWIPDDAFPHRVTAQRYRERVQQAVDANITLLRVWGGGIFESDEFYDACDELGVMVWQDFLFACAAYAEEEPMWSEVEAEARDNVARLMRHASLTLWNGSNENLEGFHDWGWEARLQGRTWGAGFYDELLPAIVSELDPGRPYTPSSPWSAGQDAGPNDPKHGSIHVWDMWNRSDYENYRLKDPRFVAEFGWQGPPTWSTLTAAITDEPLTPESPGMLVHQKAVDGNAKLTDGLVLHLPWQDAMPDWHWAMSLSQALAVATGIEHFRSRSPHCMGTIVWQLNDCWPVTSWAAIDGNGRAKPLLYAIKHAYDDVLVTIQPRDRGLAAIIVNDAAESISGTLTFERSALDGTSLARVETEVFVPARSTETLLIPAGVQAVGDASSELLSASIDGRRGLWFPAQYKDSTLGPADVTATAARTQDGYRITVAAHSVVRDLALLVDRVDPHAVVSDMLVTLLPGETAVFDVRSALDVDPDSYLDPAVLRSANDLLHPAARS